MHDDVMPLGPARGITEEKNGEESSYGFRQQVQKR